MENSRTGNRSLMASESASSSGIGEIVGLAAVAVLAMALLAVGYNVRPATGDMQAQGQQQTSQPSTALGATPQTQPRAAGNDTPAAPTQSTTGQGANNGSTGTPTNNAGGQNAPAGTKQ